LVRRSPLPCLRSFQFKLFELLLEFLDLLVLLVEVLKLCLADRFACQNIGQFLALGLERFLELIELGPQFIELRIPS
jgi:hypothetical protein